MRADNRHDRGGGRRFLPAAMLALFAALPAVCLASAAGQALWSKVELTAFTTLGIMRLELTTTREDAGLRLDHVKIELDGKAVRIPAKVDLHVSDPILSSVQVITTRSISCLDDECPDPAGWPVYVELPFGDYAASPDEESECEYSLLHVGLAADGITDITLWICESGKQTERVLYSRDIAGAH